MVLSINSRIPSEYIFLYQIYNLILNIFWKNEKHDKQQIFWDVGPTVPFIPSFSLTDGNGTRQVQALAMSWPFHVVVAVVTAPLSPSLLSDCP